MDREFIITAARMTYMNFLFIISDRIRSVASNHQRLVRAVIFSFLYLRQSNSSFFAFFFYFARASPAF